MEKRSIKVNLKTAKEWFNGNNKTLKELALQAFSEEELMDIKKGDIVFSQASDQSFIFVWGYYQYPCIYFGVRGVQEWEFEDHMIFMYVTKRKATKEEIELYKSTLLENGYLYENNQLIRTRKRKRVAKEDIYYTIAAPGEIVPRTDYNTLLDDRLFNISNYFTSREEAEIYLNKFLQILKE